MVFFPRDGAPRPPAAPNPLSAAAAPNPKTCKSLKNGTKGQENTKEIQRKYQGNTAGTAM
jgi:hypothetical protein